MQKPRRIITIVLAKTFTSSMDVQRMLNDVFDSPEIRLVEDNVPGNIGDADLLILDEGLRAVSGSGHALALQTSGSFTGPTIVVLENSDAIFSIDYLQRAHRHKNIRIWNPHEFGSRQTLKKILEELGMFS